jgi:hypothetical protein
MANALYWLGAEPRLSPRGGHADLAIASRVRNA